MTWKICALMTIFSANINTSLTALWSAELTSELDLTPHQQYTAFQGTLHILLPRNKKPKLLRTPM
ncbi:uncharacterized protein LOC143035243 isoform X2 [Oratosquilla oratoria]|uniref:uncharacterized protein LOC143035243 isoform X2 n=1 Tax=Oratosquilla oratoria TaxID=337810 RepID=UPI003F757F40